MYWQYYVLLTDLCAQLGDLYREAGAGLLLAGLGEMYNLASECPSVPRDLSCRVLCVTPHTHRGATHRSRYLLSLSPPATGFLTLPFI